MLLKSGFRAKSHSTLTIAGLSTTSAERIAAAKSSKSLMSKNVSSGKISARTAFNRLYIESIVALAVFREQLLPQEHTWREYCC